MSNPETINFQVLEQIAHVLYGKQSARKAKENILSLIREVINDIDIENPYSEDTSHYNGLNAGVNLFRKAILKALVGEELEDRR